MSRLDAIRIAQAELRKRYGSNDPYAPINPVTGEPEGSDMDLTMQEGGPSDGGIMSDGVGPQSSADPYPQFNPRATGMDRLTTAALTALPLVQAAIGQRQGRYRVHDWSGALGGAAQGFVAGRGLQKARQEGDYKSLVDQWSARRLERNDAMKAEAARIKAERDDQEWEWKKQDRADLGRPGPTPGTYRNSPTSYAPVPRESEPRIPPGPSFHQFGAEDVKTWWDPVSQTYQESRTPHVSDRMMGGGSNEPDYPITNESLLSKISQAKKQVMDLEEAKRVQEAQPNERLPASRFDPQIAEMKRLRDALILQARARGLDAYLGLPAAPDSAGSVVPPPDSSGTNAAVRNLTGRS